MCMLACWAKPHPPLNINKKWVWVNLHTAAAHPTNDSLCVWCQKSTLCIFEWASCYFRQTFNDHGGWCRHTAKWWHSCLGVWGPAYQLGPGKKQSPCKPDTKFDHLLMHVTQVRCSAALQRPCMIVGFAGVHSSSPGFVQQPHSHPGAVTQRSDGPSARGDPSCPALCHSVPTGPDCTGKANHFHPLQWNKVRGFLCSRDWRFLLLLKISTVGESEDSQESVDSVTDSQKRREILSRRPSYRSGLHLVTKYAMIGIQ